MNRDEIETFRAFNRRVTRAVGALEESYLSLGRPLGEARLIFEIAGGADVSQLRERLGLDSGYLSRLLRSLETQGLVTVDAAHDDGRRRIASLTARGKKERAEYDRLSDKLVRTTLEALDENRRALLISAVSEVTGLLRAASVTIAEEAPDSPAGIFARNAYFAELADRFEEGFDPAAHNPKGDSEMESADGCFLIARIDGEVVGCGGMKRLDAKTVEIKRVWVSPSARGLGIARRIMEMLEQRARSNGASRVRLDTNRALTEAQRMYQQIGYREIARYNDNPYAHHWFEKQL